MFTKRRPNFRARWTELLFEPETRWQWQATSPSMPTTNCQESDTNCGVCYNAGRK